jgi:hypothetical protein
MDIRTAEAIFNKIQADSAQGGGPSNYWTGLSAAISSSSNLLVTYATATAADYERIGRESLDLASDYARGLSNLAEGMGNAADRAIFEDGASGMVETIDRIRAGGAEAYVGGQLVKLLIVPGFTSLQSGFGSKVGKDIEVKHYGKLVVSCRIGGVGFCISNCASAYECRMNLFAVDTAALMFMLCMLFVLTVFCWVAYLLKRNRELGG